MKKHILIYLFRYTCLVCVFTLGLMTIVGSNGGPEFELFTIEERCVGEGCPEPPPPPPPPPPPGPPTVTSIYPSDGEGGVGITTPIEVTFNVEMDASTINSTSFRLWDSAGNLVISSIDYNNKTAILWPNQMLATNSHYLAMISNSVQSTAGDLLDQTYSWDFTTGTSYWLQITNALLSPRLDHTTVWTGTEMFVWGGAESAPPYRLNTGDRYDPVTDTWQQMSTINAPSARRYHTVVWTGTEMIIWGGFSHFERTSIIGLNSGGIYDPVTDTWQQMSTLNAPSARQDHTAVWTGMEMIVWGGFGENGFINSGGIYDPVTDTWKLISTLNAPSKRNDHTAVWTGTEMLVWGGKGNGGKRNSGGIYDPVTDTWQQMSTLNAPSARHSHTAVWTGMEMIVWGGIGDNGRVNSGGIYDPVTDTWSEITTIGAPEPRIEHTAVWTDEEMLIWGGSDRASGVDAFKNGGAYDPITDSWRTVTIANAPLPRSRHTAIWTDFAMIVWGGLLNSGNGTNTGGMYTP